MRTRTQLSWKWLLVLALCFGPAVAWMPRQRAIASSNSNRRPHSAPKSPSASIAVLQLRGGGIDETSARSCTWSHIAPLVATQLAWLIGILLLVIPGSFLSELGFLDPNKTRQQARLLRRVGEGMLGVWLVGEVRLGVIEANTTARLKKLAGYYRFFSFLRRNFSLAYDENHIWMLVNALVYLASEFASEFADWIWGLFLYYCLSWVRPPFLLVALPTELALVQMVGCLWWSFPVLMLSSIFEPTASNAIGFSCIPTTIAFILSLVSFWGQSSLFAKILQCLLLVTHAVVFWGIFGVASQSGTWLVEA